MSPRSTGAAGRESSLTLQRGLALLQAVADAEAEAPTISELAAAVGTSRAAVYRLLVPLADRGLVRRDGSRVRLGLGVLRLAARVLPQLRPVAAPVLRELADTAGATAHLTVADGDEAQVVAVVEPTATTWHLAYRVGHRHRLGGGAAGRAILLPVNGPAWITSADDRQPGVFGLAAPVRGLPDLRAAVGVLALRPPDEQQAGPAVVRAAATLGRLLAES